MEYTMLDGDYSKFVVIQKSSSFEGVVLKALAIQSSVSIFIAFGVLDYLEYTYFWRAL